MDDTSKSDNIINDFSSHMIRKTIVSAGHEWNIVFLLLTFPDFSIATLVFRAVFIGKKSGGGVNLVQERADPAA